MSWMWAVPAGPDVGTKAAFCFPGRLFLGGLLRRFPPVGVVKALLAKGANVELRANDGATALRVAKTQQIKQLLRAAGATK